MGVGVALLTAVGCAVAVSVGVAVPSVRVGVTTPGVDVGGAVGEANGVTRSDAVGSEVTVTGVAALHPTRRPASSATAQESDVHRSV